jgi:hypothetical protein
MGANNVDVRTAGTHLVEMIDYKSTSIFAFTANTSIEICTGDHSLWSHLQLFLRYSGSEHVWGRPGEPLVLQ